MCCISLRRCYFGMETRVIIKILTHPCCPRNFDWFSWGWSKKIKMADSKKLSFSIPPIRNILSGNLHWKCGLFFPSKYGPWTQIPSQIMKSFKYLVIFSFKFSNLPSDRSQNWWKMQFRFLQEKLWLQYWYRNSTLVSVSVPDTDTEFRSDTTSTLLFNKLETS